MEHPATRGRTWLCLCPLEGGFIRFFAFRKFFGVLEYWSDGVLEMFDYSVLLQKQNFEKLSALSG